MRGRELRRKKQKNAVSKVKTFDDDDGVDEAERKRRREARPDTWILRWQRGIFKIGFCFIEIIVNLHNRLNLIWSKYSPYYVEVFEMRP